MGPCSHARGGGELTDQRDERKREPIKAPEPDKKREGIRAVFEAVAQIDPVTAGLTRLYQTTHPSKAEQDRQCWQEAISERTNEHSGRLDQHENLIVPKATLTGVAVQLLAALAH